MDTTAMADLDLLESVLTTLRKVVSWLTRGNWWAIGSVVAAAWALAWFVVRAHQQTVAHIERVLKYEGKKTRDRLDRLEELLLHQDRLPQFGVPAAKPEDE